MMRATKPRSDEATKDEGLSRCLLSIRHSPFAIRNSARADHSWRGRGTRARAALLLEVVIALSIMVTAMAFVGAQLVGGMQYVGYSDQQARAGELADRMLALLELDMTASAQLIEDLSAEGDFKEQYPGYMWRATVRPLTDVAGLNQVTLEILYQPDPDLQDVSDIDQAGVVQRLHLLKADPGRLDLEADFGVPAEQLEQFGDLVPIPGFDPTQLDPQLLMSIPPEELLAMLVQLMPLLQSQFAGAGGAGMPDLANMSPEDLQAYFMEQMAGRGQQGDRGQRAEAGDVAGGEDGFEGGGPPRPGADGPMGLEELFRLQREFEQTGSIGGAPQGGARGGRGGAGRGGARGGNGNAGGRNGGGRGGNAGGGGGNAGQGGGRQPVGIGDLDALRDRLNDAAAQGGGGRGGSGNRTTGGNRGGGNRGAENRGGGNRGGGGTAGGNNRGVGGGRP
jgi:hypothetical protein